MTSKAIKSPQHVHRTHHRAAVAALIAFICPCCVLTCMLDPHCCGLTLLPQVGDLVVTKAVQHLKSV